MRNDSDCECCRELFPEYVAGALSSDESAEVARHLAICAFCARDLAEWKTLAGAVRQASREATPVLAFEASWDLLAARIAQPVPDSTIRTSALEPAERLPAAITEAVVTTKGGRKIAAAAAIGQHVAHVLGGQIRLLRPAIWIASALGILFAVLYALTLPRVLGEQDVLAFALPLIAATGTAFLYGPDVDAGLELALATPTSPRLVLMSRFALLFGYDVALALAGTLALAIARHDGFVSLAAVWFGPMALLSTLSLAFSLILGPAVAVGGAAALWLSRTLRLDNGLSFHISASTFWPTTAQILALSLALLAFALLYVPRRGRLRPEYDT